MMTTPGPKRLILIRSGRYDYAEVVLGNSTHLVGANNVGKTSLIATLQFLYIAAFSEMKFSRSWDESQRYYFQDDTSTILFEISTADGRFVTFGLRGRGQLGGYHVDRFAFEGPYQRIDFLTTDNQVREFTEVKAKLAGDRFFKIFDPADIRAAVVGDYTAVPELNLGIVPLKNLARYSDFIYLLKNLLRLNSLSQNDIKDTLLNVYRHDIQTVEIDLYGTYSDLLTKLTIERVKLRSLRTVASLTSGLKSNLERRTLSRQNLPAMYVALVAAKARTLTEIQKSLDDLASKTNGLDSADQSAITQQELLENENTGILTELTRVTDWISALESERKALLNFLPAMAMQERKNLEFQIDSLTAKIEQAGDPVALDQALTKLCGNLERATEQRDNHANLLGTRLLKHLESNTISDLGRIFHPVILGLPIESGTIEITDEHALIKFLKSLRDYVVDGHLRVAGLDLVLDRIASADTVMVADIASLNAEIESLAHQVVKETEALDIARNLAARKEDRNKLKESLQAAEAIAGRHEKFLRDMPLLPENQRKYEQLDAAKKSNLAKRSKLVEEGKERVRVRNSIQDSGRGLELRRQGLQGIRPTSIDPSWPVHEEDPEWLMLDVQELNTRYVQTHVRYLEADAGVASILEQAELVYQDGFAGDNQNERIDALLEAIDSIEDHQRSFEEQLGFAITGMRSSFGIMFKAYNDLSECVKDFSRSMGKVSISNLSQLGLELYENTELTKHYRSISTSDLLNEPEKAEEAIEVIASTIEKTRVLHLSDWFGVRFVVTAANGETKRYDDLTLIESNGTTMAIKILVNIVLIRAMMRKNKAFVVPFYIDEATQIDEANLREIIALANEKGFCPVLASTVAASVAENIDFVRTVGSDRAVIDPKWRITRESKRSDANAS